jgi:DNA-directed RNA polymerase subunit RPC12/RpoP
MQKNLFERWVFGKISRPLSSVFQISSREVEGLICRKCNAELGDQKLANLGGGSFILCPHCRSRHFVKSESSPV